MPLPALTLSDHLGKAYAWTVPLHEMARVTSTTSAREPTRTMLEGSQELLARLISTTSRLSVSIGTFIANPSLAISFLAS